MRWRNHLSRPKCRTKAQHSHQNHPKCAGETICPTQSAEQRPNIAAKITQSALAPKRISDEKFSSGIFLPLHNDLTSALLTPLIAQDWPNLATKMAQKNLQRNSLSVGFFPLRETFMECHTAHQNGPKKNLNNRGLLLRLVLSLAGPTIKRSTGAPPKKPITQRQPQRANTA